jgi:hypothetical protein
LRLFHQRLYVVAASRLDSSPSSFSALLRALSN